MISVRTVISIIPNANVSCNCNIMEYAISREYFQTAIVILKELRKEFVTKTLVSVFVRKATVVKGVMFVS